MTKVLIKLAVKPEPILAEIPNFDATTFVQSLNGQVLFIELGGNIINRQLIQTIEPIEEINAE